MAARNAFLVCSCSTKPILCITGSISKKNQPRIVTKVKDSNCKLWDLCLDKRGVTE